MMAAEEAPVRRARGMRIDVGRCIVMVADVLVVCICRKGGVAIELRYKHKSDRQKLDGYAPLILSYSKWV